MLTCISWHPSIYSEVLSLKSDSFNRSLSSGIVVMDEYGQLL